MFSAAAGTAGGIQDVSCRGQPGCVRVRMFVCVCLHDQMFLVSRIKKNAAPNIADPQRAVGSEGAAAATLAKPAAQGGACVYAY